MRHTGGVETATERAGPGAEAQILHFQMLARYSSIANQRLYEVCARLSDEEYRKQRSGSHRSIHRTLNHILLGDRIWMDRFGSAGITATPALDTELYSAFGGLRSAREAEDARIEAFMGGLNGAFLACEIRYTNNAGRACADPASLLIAHLFNHQTHHRAQVHVMLSDAGLQPPSLDMHRAIRP